MRQAGDAPKLNRRHLLALGLVAAPVAGAASEAAAAWPRRKPKTPPPPPPPAATTAPAPEAPSAEFDDEPPLPQAAPAPAPGTLPPPDWGRLRAQWDLDWSEVDLAAMLFAANPRPVREAITRHRMALDRNPITYLEHNNKRGQNLSRAAAGAYFGVPTDHVALCESTTAGIGLLYGGLTLRYGQEVLTSVHDYYVTHESLRLSAQRNGFTVRKITLHDGAETASTIDIVSRITRAITPATRVLALTWVHSSTGLKLPIRAIADALRPINAGRQPADQIIFCVDGVHGFGVENTTLPELGCDVLVASCHKWLFGPRGTGVVFFSPQALQRLSPVIPSFLASNAYSAWIGGYDPGPTTAARMTPGGFKAFEHVWALADAFQFHQSVGKEHVARRTHDLAGQLKSGLAAMPHVRVRTPISPTMSAGIVSFDVAGMSARGVVSRLRQWRIIGSAAPYGVSHARLTPSIRNTPDDIAFALKAIAALG
ncbi:MAG: aminotransferase [Phenylobacterium sp.]|uniref:aminotransferase class V-fold PLP-dependent enzyme n=1 Tax=Phenylobacterium sp. TaxID=1871053 RepID=UPI0025E7D2A6|nr:aminotransferase class V-fold PLP-dependent enzyme [Phenylobacterium sp.]MBA4013655.1 aminotransferase [Phenylobacterium sp.]